MCELVLGYAGTVFCASNSCALLPCYMPLSFGSAYQHVSRWRRPRLSRALTVDAGHVLDRASSLSRMSGFECFHQNF